MASDNKSVPVAVFTDGQSLFNLMRIHGIGQTNYARLLQIISQEVGNEVGRIADIRSANFVTAVENPGRFKKSVEAGGFKFIPTAHNTPGSDDREINRLIVNTNPAYISVLVLVSADVQDFLESLQRKMEQGIHIVIVATTATDTNGYAPLSPLSQQIIKDQKFQFVELGRYKEELMLRPWIDRRTEHEAQNKKIGITISCPSDILTDENRLKFFAHISSYVLKHNLTQFVISFETARVVISVDSPENKRTFDGLFMLISHFCYVYDVDFVIRRGEEPRQRA